MLPLVDTWAFLAAPGFLRTTGGPGDHIRAPFCGFNPAAAAETVPLFDGSALCLVSFTFDYSGLALVFIFIAAFLHFNFHIVEVEGWRRGCTVAVRVGGGGHAGLLRLGLYLFHRSG